MQLSSAPHAAVTTESSHKKQQPSQRKCEGTRNPEAPAQPPPVTTFFKILPFPVWKDREKELGSTM